MKRTCTQKPALRRHSHDLTKKSLPNSTSRHGRKTSISAKKTINYHHPYLTKKKRLSFCSINNNDIDLNSKSNTRTLCHNRLQEDLADVDPTYLSTLRHEAYDELHRKMQQYNDSFVIRMQQAEQQRHEVTDQRPPHHRRRSFQKHLTRRPSAVSSTCPKQYSHNHHCCHHQHHRPRLHYHHQQDNDPGIEELVDMLETGTIKDYSILTEWELCQNPQIDLEEEQHGGFGDLW